ncbi:hypothetical protein ACFWNL_18280 [Kitasatospora sp. NPDC058397]|uniref:hypothetical protein n=1 Tax=unclassified Kitasatospora TaxID=2633591 RepID=UPI003660F3A7
MPKAKTPTIPTFAALASDYGKALAYLAGQQEGTTLPADPAIATPTELADLAAGAVTALERCHYWNEAEEMQRAADYLRDATADDADDADDLSALLRRADKVLRAHAYDAACEVADALGEPRDF